jgi:hypothetical protein
MSATFFRDAAERIAWTFVYAVVQYLITATVYDVETLKAALLAGVPVVLVTIKALVASQVGNPDSAAIGAGD